MKEFLYVLLIGFILGSVTTYFVKPNEVVERIDSVTIAVDTNKFMNQFKAELEAKYRVELDKKPKVIRVKGTVNVDSLYKEAKRYAVDSLKVSEDIGYMYNFVAYADTTFEDLTGSTYVLASSISPIPFHPTTRILIEGISRHTCMDSTETKYKTVEVSLPFYKNKWFYVASVALVVCLL